MSSLLYASLPGCICSDHFYPLWDSNSLKRQSDWPGLGHPPDLWLSRREHLTDRPKKTASGEGQSSKENDEVTGRKQGCQTDTDTGSPLSPLGRLPSSCHHSSHCQLTDLCPHTTWGPQRKTLVNQVKAYETRWHPQLKSLPDPKGPDTMSCSSAYHHLRHSTCTK